MSESTQTLHISSAPGAGGGKPPAPAPDKPVHKKPILAAATPMAELTTPAYTDEQIIHITQNKRLELLEITRTTLDMSRATAVAAHLAIIDSLSSTAQANIKTKQQEGAAGMVAGASALMTSLLMTMGSGKNNPMLAKEGEEGVIPSLGEDIPEPVLLPGETHVGVENLSKEEFLDE